MPMGIEKDIHQIRKFRNEHHKAVVNLMFTNNWVEQQLKQFLDGSGLTLQQYNMLRILNGATEPLTTLTIRERMLDKMSDTSRIVDRLVLKQLVKKTISKVDKRLVDVVITKKGRTLIANLDKEHHHIDGVVKNLSPDEAKLINILFDKIRSSD
jgi:DNA-binding MarR family transcriptional regulator